MFGAIFFIICCFGIFLYISHQVENHKIIGEVTNTNRGEYSERDLILKLRRNGVESSRLLHDLYIPTKGNNFSQIDLLLLSPVGIVVFEVKDYSGWIFGDARQNQWTQVLNYGKEKHRFYNPIIQNAVHITHLKKYLMKEAPCFSVIVFSGDCELKSINFVPQNTFVVKPNRVLDVINTIYGNNTKRVIYTEKTLQILKQAVSYGANPEIRKRHIENIHDMLGKDRIFR